MTPDHVAPLDLVHRLRVTVDAFGAVQLLAADERETFERLLAGNAVEAVIVRAIAADLAALVPVDAELYFDATAIRLDAAGLAGDPVVARARSLVALAVDAGLVTAEERAALDGRLVPGARTATVEALAVKLASAAPDGSGVEYTARALLAALPLAIR